MVQNTLCNTSTKRLVEKKSTQHSRIIHEVLEVPGHHHGDFHELVHQVVGKVDVVSDAAGHTWDVREEAVHTVLVPVTNSWAGRGRGMTMLEFSVSSNK